MMLWSNSDTLRFVKGQGDGSHGKLHRYVEASFERIALDIFAQLLWSSSGNTCIIILIKGPEIFSFPDQDMSTVADVLVQLWLSIFAQPCRLIPIKERSFPPLYLKDIVKYSDCKRLKLPICTRLFCRELLLLRGLLFSCTPIAS